jgi:hypothetical protein
VAAWLLAAVLRWKEPKAGGGGAATTSSIKLAGYSPDLGDFALFPLSLVILVMKIGRGSAVSSLLSDLLMPILELISSAHITR